MTIHSNRLSWLHFTTSIANILLTLIVTWIVNTGISAPLSFGMNVHWLVEVCRQNNREFQLSTKCLIKWPMWNILLLFNFATAQFIWEAVSGTTVILINYNGSGCFSDARRERQLGGFYPPKPVITFKIEMYFSSCHQTRTLLWDVLYVTNGNTIDRFTSPIAASQHQVLHPLPKAIRYRPTGRRLLYLTLAIRLFVPCLCYTL